MAAAGSGGSPTAVGEDEPLPEGAVDAHLGQVLDGRYELVRLIGEGGMGAVYEGRHVKLGRRVAVKMIHDELSKRPEVLSRFEREVEANARLEHPHIANAIDCGTSQDGAAYLVLQLVEGQSLRELVGEGPVDWRRACELGAQIADALAAAHAASVIHRDLKPSNVIIERDGAGRDRVRVLDFGIASLADDAPAREGTPLTREGHVVGTIGYMAPEQALARGVTPESDLYSVGVLLWEMLAGERLFDRPQLTVSSYIVCQLTEPCPPAVEGPEELRELIAALLRNDVDERPGDAGAIRDRLRAIARLESEPPQRGAEATSPASAPSPSSSEPAPARAAAKPSLAARVAPGLAALIVGSLALAGALASSAWAADSITDKGKTPKAKGAATAPSIPLGQGAPDPLAVALDALVRPDPNWRVRREAARLLMDHDGAISPFARNVARLEIAASCEVRVDAAEALVQEADRRAEGVLRRRRRDRCRALRAAIEEGLQQLGR